MNASVREKEDDLMRMTRVRYWAKETNKRMLCQRARERQDYEKWGVYFFKKKSDLKKKTRKRMENS